MKVLSIDELLDIYNKAEQVDQELFAEQRSNLQLVAGDHYNKRGSRYWNRIRDSKEITQEQKLRLTKNHLQKITKTYVNMITSYAPGVTIVPNNDKEYQDQKAATLNNSVLQYAKNKIRIKEKILQWASDFIDIGEVATKLFWDPSAGDFMGYEPILDEESGEPLLDEKNEPKQRAVFSGDIMVERVYGFNLLRVPQCTDMNAGPYPVVVRKMIHTEDLKEKCAGDPDKLRMINDSEDKTFKVFDAAINSYGTSEGQTMLMEFYYPKCERYPMGYFYYATFGGILWHGELPFGIWPLIYTGFDAIATSARSRSIIKQLRPFQAEINRSASKMAEHQITLGDDKLLVSGNAKISNGVQLPGVRTIQYSGAEPTFLAGRSGEQYLGYMNSQISEMYQVANLEAELAEKDASGDVLMNLFKSIKQKKKFTVYTDKFESFMVRFWETYLDLAKSYFPEEMLIPMIGRDELVNISDFKNTQKLSYQIKVEPQTDDVESMMGRQVIFNHILQYVGPNLDKKSIGQLIKQMPFGNWKAGFGELTMDEEMATNMILALDRGKIPQPNKYDDAPYMIKRLTERQRQADFELLDPRIKQAYEMMTAHYEQMEEQRQQQIQAAQKGYIPSGGARVKADFYVSSPTNPNKTERATIPAEAIDWLLKRLAEQGSSQEQLQQMNQGAVAEMAAHLNQQEAQGIQGQRMPQQAPQGTGPASPQPGGM